ncbi:MAG: nucleotide pyrophosphohydrolase, partial [Planctomycetaceae bacterium]|nr:nucleotide pyrophosphohydrolase [Planctomycetaceae bacterium]
MNAENDTNDVSDLSDISMADFQALIRKMYYAKDAQRGIDGT